jgi:V/A-type H+-transporting ATPase subunit F
MAYHIIGDADTVLGFRFAGATGEGVETAPEAADAFRRAIRGHKTDILLITATVENMIPKEVTAHRLTGSAPYLVVVEGVWGGGKPRQSLEGLISEAVGIRMDKDNP